MSEQFEVQFQTEDGAWETLHRSGSDEQGRYTNVADAFILLGTEIERDPDMTHRIVRFVEEVVVTIPQKETK